MGFLEISKKIAKILKKNIPKHWDGKIAILEMKNNYFPHWKQMEWIGFYFQFLCLKYLKNVMNFPGKKYGNVEFDAFLEIPWDFKSHAINTSSHQIIVNDSNAILNGINDYGAVGLVLALGKVEYNDEERTFQKWHEELKGGPSDYTLARIKRGAWSRLRKVSFDLQQISFIEITNNTLNKCGTFQENFRNADGSPRRAKVLLNLEQIDEEIKYFLEF